MYVELECTYCGFKWEESVSTKAEIDEMACIHGNCGDTNLKVRDVARTKIDYYQGSPPFQDDIARYFGNIYGRSE